MFQCCSNRTILFCTVLRCLFFSVSHVKMFLLQHTTGYIQLFKIDSNVIEDCDVFFSLSRNRRYF